MGITCAQALRLGRIAWAFEHLNFILKYLMPKCFVLDEVAAHLNGEYPILRRFVRDELPGHLNCILKLVMPKRFVLDELARHLMFVKGE